MLNNGDDWDNLIEKIDQSKIDINIDVIKELDKHEEIDLDPKAPVFEIIDYKACPICGVRCRLLDNSVLCEKCGLERECSEFTEGYSLSIEQGYTTLQNSYIPFNIIGSGSYCYNRSLLKTCSDYTIYRANTNRRELINIIFQYEGSKPPNNVIVDALDIFDKIISAGYIYRKNGRLGVMSACLYYACVMNNLSRTPKDIATIMGTTEHYLSQGDKILQELNELSIINIPTFYKPIEDYINQYFMALKIPDKYKEFVIDLINRAEKKHIHTQHDCRTTTKCVGIIYLLTQRVKELNHIKKDDIARECNNISKNTFIKYYNHLCINYKLIKKSFKRHGIPMPLKWKTTH